MQGMHHNAQTLTKTAFCPLKPEICLFILSAVAGISSSLSQLIKKNIK